MHTPSSRYPAGRRRLEPIAVIISATLMGMAALEVIQKAVETLVIGYEGTLPSINMTQLTIAVLLFAISTKTILWYLCYRIGLTSPTAKALAQVFNSYRNNSKQTKVHIFVGPSERRTKQHRCCYHIPHNQST